jgi:hypothetical protein
MSTLTTLRAHPPQHTFDPALAGGGGHSKSIFSSFLPNLHGQGPIGSVVRILLKLHTSFTRVSSVFNQESLGLGPKKKDEEMRGKAIKVVDLLQHSAELGNLDALFTLAQVSLVRLIALTLHRISSPSHIAVPSDNTLQHRPRISIPFPVYARVTDWKCNIAVLLVLLPRHGVQRSRIGRSRQGPTVFNICCKWW